MYSPWGCTTWTLPKVHEGSILADYHMVKASWPSGTAAAFRVNLRRSLGSDPMFLQISWRSPAVMEKEKLECQIIILLIANKIIESINLIQEKMENEAMQLDVEDIEEENTLPPKIERLTILDPAN